MRRKHLIMVACAVSMVTLVIVLMLRQGKTHPLNHSLPHESSQGELTESTGDPRESNARVLGTQRFREPANAEASETTNSDSAGRVSGRVEMGDELPVKSCEVELLHFEESNSLVIHSTTTDDKGMFRFPGLQLGNYRLRVKQDTLPEGVLPPWEQDRIQAPPLPGFYGVVTHLTREQPIAFVEIRVHQSASIQGSVKTVLGLPVDGVSVQISCTTPGLYGIFYEVRTNHDGFFGIDNVIPGNYVVMLDIDCRPSSSSEIRKPLPQTLRLEPNQRGQVDFVVLRRNQPGGKVISGRIVNQHGSPIPSVDVLVYIMSEDPSIRKGWSWTMGAGISDDQGHFKVAGLPDELYGVQIAPNCCVPKRYPHLNRFEERIEPIYIDLRKQGSTDVGAIVLRESSHADIVTVHVNVKYPDVKDLRSLDSAVNKTIVVVAPIGELKSGQSLRQAVSKLRAHYRIRLELNESEARATWSARHRPGEQVVVLVSWGGDRVEHRIVDLSHPESKTIDVVFEGRDP